MSAKQEKAKRAAEKEVQGVNDFSMTVATVNGSGSATSNLTLLRAFFKMGIPVSGKNMFPSNIQGQPTWYTIRVSKDGYIARRETHEIVVAMNAATIAEDYQKVAPGGAFYYADHLKLEMDRDDISVYPIPAKKLAKDSGAPVSLRDYVANMAYVGVLAQMLKIDMEKIKMALGYHFQGKEKPIELNYGVIEAGAKWVEENLEKSDPFYVEEMDMTKDCIMADGNTAAALGSVYGGLQFCSWYPITPATSLPEAVNHYTPALRGGTEKGKATYAIVQSEDELAAIGMAIGAGWAGLRSMTATSGPGISLMSEFIGLAYYSETPVVIWDVQRMGPSTGLPTRTSHGDLTMVYHLGHGDTENIVLLPGSVRECFEFGWRSFDIAERAQTPVFVLSDLDLGMNHWMTKKFEYPDQDLDRGKILWEEDLDKWEGPWGRYLDVDGDGIPYRTVPGNRHEKAAWFARGTGHDDFAKYSEDSVVWEENMARLLKKFQTIRTYIPQSIIQEKEGVEIGLIGYGSTEPALVEAVDRLEELGVSLDFLRMRALPVRREVREYIEGRDRVYIMDMNRDGQMYQILTMEYPDLVDKMITLTKNDGNPLSARWVTEAILEKEGK